MSLRLLDDDYNCLPIGLLFSIDYPYRYIGRRVGPIVGMDEGGGNCGPTRGNCVSCGAADFKRGQCTYCGRHA
jgi:hypothetical protein